MNQLDKNKKNKGSTPSDRLPAARLAYWSGRPLGRANRVAIVLALLGMAWVAFSSTHMAEQVPFLRQAATLFIAGHGLAYVLWLRLLRSARGRGIVGAAKALEAYLDPRRVSNLDLAMAWVAFFAAAPLLSLVFPAQLPAGD